MQSIPSLYLGPGFYSRKYGITAWKKEGGHLKEKKRLTAACESVSWDSHVPSCTPQAHVSPWLAQTTPQFTSFCWHEQVYSLSVHSDRTFCPRPQSRKFNIVICQPWTIDSQRCDQQSSSLIHRMIQIKWHHFTFKLYWTAVFLTTKKQVKQVALSKKK